MEPPTSSHFPDDDNIDLAELGGRLRRGLAITLGLSLLGITLGIIISLAVNWTLPVATTLRMSFSFPGFEHSTYPNGQKFSPDDIRTPDIINTALKDIGLKADQGLATRIRGAISIDGVVSPEAIKQRDKLSATGQPLPAYHPDEYRVTLSLPGDSGLSRTQRAHLLNQIVSAYQSNFSHMFVDLPPEFNDLFASLQGCDYTQYELVLNQQLRALISYLQQRQSDTGDFRSPTNHLTFASLLKQAELFSQLQLNDVLSIIYTNGLSEDRAKAITQMDYYLHNLDDEVQLLQQNDSVVTSLLAQNRERAQSYMLAGKTQTDSNQPIIDQGLINSLVVNDAYNFLVRKALDSGLALKAAEADKARVVERQDRMRSFMKSPPKDQTVAITWVQQSLNNLKPAYRQLIDNTSVVLRDYTRQKYADAIRITQPASTPSPLLSLAIAAVVGLAAGAALGLGLSLLNLVPGRRFPS